MKLTGKTKTILALILVLIVIGVIVVPPRTIHGEVRGVVTGSSGVPIEGALVSRISRMDRSEGGRVVVDRVVAQSVLSDSAGSFYLPEIRKPRGLPSLEWLLWLHCYEEIEVHAPGYVIYRSEFADPDLTKTNNDFGACNKVNFRKNIELAPNNVLKPTPHRGANHMAGRACHVLHAPLRRGLA